MKSSILSAVMLAAANASQFGVDLSVATDDTTWKCLVEEKDISFSLIRVYRSVGELDANCPASLKSAHSAGIKDLHAYIFPCVSSSPYSLANNITCASPEDQVKASIDFLEDNGVSVFRNNQDIHTENKPIVRRIWLDIEDESPATYFDSDTSVNQQLLADMVHSIQDSGALVGIYTTKTYWTNIMDDVEGYSQFPLWYPRYDADNSMDFFESFGGWTDVLIKQTGGDVGYCGISQVDSDYMERG